MNHERTPQPHNRDYFPYSYTQESVSHTFGARAEGRIHEMSLKDKLVYVWKYLGHPKTCAPKEEIAYFNDQKKILALLQAQKLPHKSLKLGLVGDIMWIRRGWEKICSEKSLSLLESFDAILGNLETIVSPRFPVREYCPDRFIFNSPPTLLKNLRNRRTGQSLFSALSFANNHTYDYGDQGAFDTLESIENEKIPQSGVQKNKGEKTWTIFSSGGINFGFYAATFGLNESRLENKTKIQINYLRQITPETGNNKPDLTGIQNALQEMHKEKIDIKIISLHWGHEFETYPSPLQVQVAHQIVALGADFIYGNHPHVQQPDEICFVNGYEKSLDCNVPPGAILQDPFGKARKAFVVYSMGNFCTAMFGFLCQLAIVKELHFFRTENGQLDWLPRKPHYLYNARLDFSGTNQLQIWEEFISSVQNQKKKSALQKQLMLVKSHLEGPS